MSIRYKSFSEVMKAAWFAILILVAAIYLEVMIEVFFGSTHRFLYHIFSVIKLLSGLAIISLFFILVSRIKIPHNGRSNNAFPGGLTVHVGLWVLFYSFLSVVGLYLAFNPSIVGKLIDNSSANAEALNESLIMLFSAGVGSSVSTLLAYLLHASEKKDFDNAFVPWYFARPIMGMLLGLIFYYALKGGILVLTTTTGAENLNDYALAAVGGLVGMFSKNALEKLREVFNTLFSTRESTVQPALNSEKPATAEIVSEYFEKNKNALERKYNPIAVGIGKKEVGGLMHGVPCIVFFVANKKKFKSEHEIPPYLPYKSADGTVHSVSTDIQEEDEITSSQGTNPGNLIKVGNSEGTFGLLVTKKIAGKAEPCLLSCFHVLCGDDLNDQYVDFNASTASETKVTLGHSKIAEVVEGKLNGKIDGALAKITLPTLADPTIDHPYISAPKGGIMPIGQIHIDRPTTLYLCGGKTQHRRGVVRAYDTDASIKFGLHVFKLEKLIVTERMSDKGDSGAAVFGEDGKIVGLLVADSKHKSYIQPIVPLISQLKFEINYLP